MTAQQRIREIEKAIEQASADLRSEYIQGLSLIHI